MVSGFVWIKTIKGYRTAGFFAFKANDDKLYASDGTVLDPPVGSVMIFGEQLLVTINKSSPMGMYVCQWKKHSDEWSEFLTGDATVHYASMNAVITSIAEVVGIPAVVNHSSKEVVAEKKADAAALKEQTELEFKQGVSAALQILRSMTVRALARPPSPARAT